MSEGPGRYDELATAVREKAEAEAVVLIIVNGNKGFGFAVQSLTPEALEALPKAVRQVATAMEADNAHRKGRLS